MQSTEPETWLPIPGWERMYSISNFGNVRNDRTGYILATPPIRRGYPTVTLAGEGRRVNQSVHRLVADAFVDGDGEVIRHLDGNKMNARADNLAYGSQSENIKDAVRHGTHPNVRKTRCPAGHSLVNSPRDALGRRFCPQCVRANKESRLHSPDLEHGTQKAYSYGCRCARCVPAYAVYQKAKRDARKAGA